MNCLSVPVSQKARQMPDTAASSPTPLGARQLAAALHFGFLLIGVVNTLLGPVLPLLSVHWQLDDAQAGRLFIVQFVGSMTGSVLASVLIVRLGFRRLLVIGFCAMAAAAAGLGFGSRQFGLIAVAVSGVTLGLTVPAMNLLISYLYPERRAAALNVLNLVWGLGAMCSSLVPLAARGGSLALPLGVLTALLAALVVWLLQCEWRAAPAVREQGAAPPMRVAEILRAWLTTPYAVLTGAFVFLYAGTEAATGGWIATYAERFGGASRALWALTPMIFYGGLLTGRGLAPALLCVVPDRVLIFAGLGTTLVGLGIILASDNLSGVSGGAYLAGFGFAPVFPTTFACFTHYFGVRSPSLAGGVFVLTSLGSAFIPWTVGFVSSRTGQLAWGLAVTVVGVVAMLLLQTITLKILSRTANDEDADGEMKGSST